MHNMAYTLDNIIPITMFNRGQAGRIFSEVKKGSPKVVIKNNEPEAVIISPDEYKEIMELLENAELMEMAIQRETNDNGARFSQNEVMEELGISQADLDEMEDVEIG
ncbi:MULTISPECIES: type II toxin-antitoxin system Phd/YefM family antitoxin [unclassified Butyrivibrio]|uniref:type II toxin-antitoxin system Phd/YefM family antitoxin n=1 Tax=unclassified Butyrivibrio TaxID=2639466 RepID=UPI000EAA8F8A|nr:MULTISPECIES: type II toxin-antitoxin system Phd/YefM family antitoxin [unclassified Butyrivibrio]RKM62899.1 type II toxin-antitoxin system Phd/YefM family antitoxin [Butyrivibrio sp. XB500-5]